jgi:hypothetical protein
MILAIAIKTFWHKNTFLAIARKTFWHKNTFLAVAIMAK